MRDLLDSIDLCFLQEHWLIPDQLHKFNSLNSDFLSVSVSGMDSSLPLAGRPFGGCTILYRKCLSFSITPFQTSSDCFCAITIKTSDSLSFLMFCIYMPYENHPSSFTDYLNTLGEIQGLLDSHSYSGAFLIGDFNVDYDRNSPLTDLLCNFMTELDLVASDLQYKDSILFTYERDGGGLCRSWIDHILCSRSCSTLVSNTFASHSWSNLSDHSPLFFSIHADCQSPTCSSPAAPSSPSFPPKIDWSKASVDDVDKYCELVDRFLPNLSSDVTSCSSPDCLVHYDALDSFAQSLLSCLKSCSFKSFACVSPSPSSSHRLPGWNDSARKLRERYAFWRKVWVQAGCPSSGVLCSIKRSAKSRFKYEVRRLKRRKQFLLRKRVALAFTSRSKFQFWRMVRRLNHVKTPIAPHVDGVSGDQHIANLFSRKFEGLLNKKCSSSRSDFLSNVLASLSNSMLQDVSFTEEEVFDAINQLNPSKSDSNGIFSEHLKSCCSVIALPLSLFFTAIVRHGHMPQLLRDSALVPVPKNNKDASVSTNYRPIVLSSTLSKVLEQLILCKYSNIFTSNHLQFGFKPGSSTSFCTGMVKNIVSRYIHNGSSVLGCFLDASKAFDSVDHGILFKKLSDRGLPLAVVRVVLV